MTPALTATMVSQNAGPRAVVAAVALVIVVALAVVRGLRAPQSPRRVGLLGVFRITGLRRRLRLSPTMLVVVALPMVVVLHREDQWIWRIRQPSPVRTRTMVSVAWESISRSRHRPVVCVSAV